MSDTSISVRVLAGSVVTKPITHYRELVEHRLRSGEPMRLVDYVEVYATTHELEAETIRQYRITAERLEEWAGEPVMLRDLNELMVSAFLRKYGETAKPATVRSKRTQLMALWRSAADEYLCDPPTRRVRSARVPWEPREAWTLEEVRRLLAAASWLPRWHHSGMRRAEWFDLAIRIAWDTGLRWGDQIHLRADQIHGDIVVVGQRKTRRPVCGRLSESTVRILADNLARYPRAVVTPWKKSHETFNKQMRLLVSRAGIRPGTWKWLRRGGATDVEIQEPGRGYAAKHLGHAPGSRIAEINYLDHAAIARSVDVVSPRDLEPTRATG